VFDKLFALFAYPLGLALVGLIIGLFALLWNWRKTGLIIVLACVLGLWTASTPVFSHWLLSTLESQYPAEPITSYQPADIIILLGGSLSPGEPYPDLGEASDRVIHAYRIYKAGLGPKILISGGNVFPDGRVSEGEALADLLVSLGIDRTAIIVEGASRNTYENARETEQIWQRENFKTGLLVTSSMHMPRALAVFKRAGFAVMPASTDMRSGRSLPPFPLSILPDAGCLDQASQAIKEWIGLLVYRWRGWA